MVDKTGQGQSLGSGGECVCPKCGERTRHTAGTPCQGTKCPKCGAKMLREGSFHHKLAELKKTKK
jgi:NAD-dependent SIR2 family protein deacetylase